MEVWEVSGYSKKARRNIIDDRLSGDKREFISSGLQGKTQIH